MPLIMAASEPTQVCCSFEGIRRREHQLLYLKVNQQQGMP